MPHCKCLVLIPNPRGGNEHYAIVARTSREAAQKAMQSHPYPVPVDDVITVIADGLEPADAGASQHNARQPTFWHRAGTIRVAPEPMRFAPEPDLQRDKKLLN
jgi:hypothetical protein